MQVTVDLGFPSLLLAAFLVVAPAIGFFIRRKWRRAVARKEEIRRLLVLASEEATRAEFESNLAYYSSSSSSSQGFSSSVSGNGYLCAVCFCPTTTRCARCKAVRYCSGKCQIFHWRQGHKEECRPFNEINGMDENVRTSSQNVAVKQQDEVCNERFEDNSADTPHVEYNSTRSFEARIAKNVGSKDELANGEGISDASYSSDNSFSGFSSSPPCGSSDGASVGDSTSLTEAEGSDGSPSNDAFPDKHGFDKVDHSQSSSPKFASLVDSVDTFDEPSELNYSKAEFDNARLSKHASADSSSQSIRGTNENSTNKYADNSSGFWGRTLESVMAHHDAREGSSEAGCGGDHNNDRSHVESFLLSNATPGSNISVMHAKRLEMKGIMSENKTVTPTAVGRAVNKTLLSESPGVGNMEIRSFPSVSCRSANHVDNDSRGVSDKPKCTEQGSVLSSSGDACQSSLNNGSLPVQAPEVCTYSSVNSGGFKSVVSNAGGTSYTSNPKISSPASQSHVAPSASGQSLLDVKHDKQDNIEAGRRTSTSVNPTKYVGGLKSSVLKVVDQFRGPRYGRYSDKGLFSYDLFVKLYTSNKVELTPFGLINCGNSCYANAVLQCLAFTPPLTAYFVQGLHSESCGKKGWCFTCELERLIMKAKDGKSPLSPIGILSQLGHIGSELSNGREEDAHEFLRYSIDTMQSVCLGDSSSGHLEEETTIIGLTFGGYLHSKIRCLKCQYKSEREERMMDIAVEIEGEVVKLEDALRRFTSTEILDGDNKYQCSRCKSKEKAKKKLTILEAPNVLTIALKRFQSGKFGKLNKSIQFPEILDLAPYMSGTSDKSPIYRLYGVIVHLDVMNAAFSGHYVCYVKNFRNKWFKVDDSTVTSVDLGNVLTKGAYMLLYSRCSPRAPRLIRNSIMSSDSKNRSNPSRTNAKKNVLNSRSMSTRLNVTHSNPYKSPKNLTNVESFYLKFHRLQRILEEDSSSDSFSFTSSNSDEGSCSTDSTPESACTDDISDYIFGGWDGSWRNSSDSDTSSSSSSPMFSTYSPTSHLDVRRSSSLREKWSSTNHMGSTMVDGQPNSLRGSGGTANLEGDKGVPFWQPETNKPSRTLVGSSSCRETGSVKLGSVNHLGDVKFGTSLRRSSSERTD